MIIIPYIDDYVEFKIPMEMSIYPEGTSADLILRNTETKKEYTYGSQAEMREGNGGWYLDVTINPLDSTNPLIPGEYEYECSGNIGLLRVVEPLETKTYTQEVEFKVYEDKEQ